MGAGEAERPVDRPHVKIESQRRTLERHGGVHVQREGMAKDVMEKIVAQLDRALPQDRLVGLFGIPHQMSLAGHRRIERVLDAQGCAAGGG